MPERFVRFPALNEEVFTVGSRKFLCVDMLFFSWFTGAWGDFVSELKLKIAARRYNERYQLIPSSELVHEALVEFRYANSLENSDDCKGWLERKGLSLGALTFYLERTALLSKLSEASDSLADFMPEEAELLPILEQELLLSGRLEDYSYRFAELCCHYCADIEKDASNVMGARIDRAELDKFALLLKIEKEPEEKWIERAALFTALRNRCDHYCLKRVTKKSLHDAVAENALDWTWVDYVAAVFEEQSGADEAVLALREGGNSLVNLAQEAELEVRRLTHLLDHEPEGICEDACRHLRSAACGEVIGPIQKDSEFLVLQINKKLSPSAEQPDIKMRAERLARRRVLSKLIEERILWSR